MASGNDMSARRWSNGKVKNAWQNQLKERRNKYREMIPVLQKYDPDMANAYTAALEYVSSLYHSRDEAEDKRIENEFRERYIDVIWGLANPKESPTVASQGELERLIADIKRLGTPTKCHVFHEFGLVQYYLEGGVEFDTALENAEKKARGARTDGKYVADFDAVDAKQLRNDEIARLLAEVEVTPPKNEQSAPE